MERKIKMKEISKLLQKDFPYVSGQWKLFLRGKLTEQYFHYKNYIRKEIIEEMIK